MVVHKNIKNRKLDENIDISEYEYPGIFTKTIIIRVWRLHHVSLPYVHARAQSWMIIFWRRYHLL